MRARRVILGAVVALGCAGSGAQAADCRNPVDQHTMNNCAADDYDAADRALNLQYKVTRKVLAGASDGADRRLVTAQKAWIAFRDGHCDTVAAVVAGGTMEPLLRYSCLAETTRARTVQLKQLAEDFGN
jgi:uncharacterized protein YecT (DUF1311 family)